jgi:dihydroflavonol-4-reductase
MRRRALITGATGFVGSHLSERLHGQGWLVRALVRESSDTGLLRELGAEMVVGDLTDAEDVGRAAAGCEVVFHLAAATFEPDEASFVRANVGGTRAVARGAVVAGARRLVYLSSYAACGPSSPGRPRDAEQEPEPLTAYGRSKLAGERVVEETEGVETGDRSRAGGVRTARSRAPLLLPAGALVARARAGGGDRELHLIYAPDLAGHSRAPPMDPSAPSRSRTRGYTHGRDLVAEIAGRWDAAPHAPGFRSRWCAPRPGHRGRIGRLAAER